MAGPDGLAAAAAALAARATWAALGSRLHGLEHWRAVARVGVELARRTPGADLDVVVLFALAHDTQRRHDGRDPDHGRRAAAVVRDLAGAGAFGLDPGRLDLLCLACAGHADGGTSADPTVGACWDADRLNLWRVGTTPARGLLSTAAARSAEVYDWSRGVHAAGAGWREVEAAVGGGRRAVGEL